MIGISDHGLFKLCWASLPGSRSCQTPVGDWQMLAVARRSVAYIVSIVLLCTGLGLLGMATFDYLDRKSVGRERV